MTRRLLNLLTAGSLLLCVATAALWLRSYWRFDKWERDVGTQQGHWEHEARSARGRIMLSRMCFIYDQRDVGSRQLISYWEQRLGSTEVIPGLSDRVEEELSDMDWRHFGIAWGHDRLMTGGSDPTGPRDAHHASGAIRLLRHRHRHRTDVLAPPRPPPPASRPPRALPLVRL